MPQSYMLICFLLACGMQPIYGQYLGVLGLDKASNRKACVVFNSDTTQISPALQVQESVLALTFYNGNAVMSTAKLAPNPIINHAEGVTLPFSGMSGNVIVIGGDITCEIKPSDIEEYITHGNGLLEEKLLHTTEKLISTCPQLASATVSFYWIEGDTLVHERHASNRGAHPNQAIELEKSFQPFLINYLKSLAQDTHYIIDALHHRITLQTSDTLTSYPLQIKVLNNTGQTMVHRALKESITQLNFRKDQWADHLTFLILYENEIVLWKEIWN